MVPVVIAVILLALLALFVLLRYEKYAHRDNRPSATMTDDEGKVVPIRHGVLDDSLFAAIKHGVADDWRRLRRKPPAS